MMDVLKFVTADVFTTSAFGGNPLAVVLDGRGLSSTQMQAIAREFNLSETTFILPPANPVHKAQVRIFTPVTELAFAGHPTVGTAWAMAHLGLIKPSGSEASITFEEGVGLVPLTIKFADGKPSYVSFSTAIVPDILPPPPVLHELAGIVNLSVADMRQAGAPPMSLTCGTPYTCIPLASSDAVARASLNMELWHKHLAATPAHKVYVFTRNGSSTVHARMFAPGEGVTEDPATGSAACAVAEWLVRDDGLQNATGRWTINQGQEIGRPSQIFIEADIRGGKITAVRCGGTAVMMTEGTIRRPV